MPYALAALGLGLGGSIGGSLISANAAGSAANTQAAAARNAANLQSSEFQQISQNLDPYRFAGYNALNEIQSPYFRNTLFSNPYLLVGQNPQVGNIANQPQLPQLPQFQPLTLQSFQASPGYQYELQQQQDAIQNSAAGRTGAISGNTLEALQANAQGLASQDWWNAQNFNAQEQQFNLQNILNQYNAQNQAYTQTQGYLGNAFNQLLGGQGAQQSNIANILLALSGAGQNAATNTGGFGQTSVTNQGNLLTGAANAQAAGQIGQANAFTGGINNALTQLLSAQNPNYGNNSNLAFLFNQFGGGGNQDFSGGQTGSGFTI